MTRRMLCNVFHIRKWQYGLIVLAISIAFFLSFVPAQAQTIKPRNSSEDMSSSGWDTPCSVDELSYMAKSLEKLLGPIEKLSATYPENGHRFDLYFEYRVAVWTTIPLCPEAVLLGTLLTQIYGDYMIHYQMLVGRESKELADAMFSAIGLEIESFVQMLEKFLPQDVLGWMDLAYNRPGR